MNVEIAKLIDHAILLPNGHWPLQNFQSFEMHQSLLVRAKYHVQGLDKLPFQPGHQKTKVYFLKQELVQWERYCPGRHGE